MPRWVCLRHIDTSVRPLHGRPCRLNWTLGRCPLPTLSGTHVYGLAVMLNISRRIVRPVVSSRIELWCYRCESACRIHSCAGGLYFSPDGPGQCAENLFFTVPFEVGRVTCSSCAHCNKSLAWPLWWNRQAFAPSFAAATRLMPRNRRLAQFMEAEPAGRPDRGGRRRYEPTRSRRVRRSAQGCWYLAFLGPRHDDSRALASGVEHSY